MFTKIPLRASLGIRSLISVLSKAARPGSHGGSSAWVCSHITHGAGGGCSWWVWQTHHIWLQWGPLSMGMADTFPGTGGDFQPEWGSQVRL